DQRSDPVQGTVEVHVVQRVRREHQVEPPVRVRRHVTEVAQLVADAGPGPVLPGELDHRRGQVHRQDLVVAVGQHRGLHAGAAAEVEGPVAAGRQVEHQPGPQLGTEQRGDPVVPGGEVVEGAYVDGG